MTDDTWKITVSCGAWRGHTLVQKSARPNCQMAVDDAIKAVNNIVNNATDKHLVAEQTRAMLDKINDFMFISCVPMHSPLHNALGVVKSAMEVATRIATDEEGRC